MAVIDDAVREVAALGEHATLRIGLSVECVLLFFLMHLPAGVGVQFILSVNGGYRCAGVLEGLYLRLGGLLCWGGQKIRGVRETELFH